MTNEDAHDRIMRRITEGLDAAACVAVIVGVDRQTFVEAARQSYDFIEQWHNFARKNKATGDG